MRKYKMFLTAFILLMTLFVFSVNASGAETGVWENGFYYEVVDGEAIIRRGGTSGIKNIVIPETLGGYPVTEINMENSAADIKSKAITLPKTLKRIGNINSEHHFEQLYVDSIETWLNITENNSMLYGLFFNTDFYVDGKIVTDIVIPDSKTEINTYAFLGLKINSVTFSESIQSVSSHAFDSSFLKKVYVPDLETWFKICNICTYTNPEIYINNEKPVDIVIPENIDTIPAYAFEDFKIKSITFTNPIKNFGYYWLSPHYMVDAFYVDSFETWMNFNFEDYPLDHAKCLYIDGEAVAGDYVFPETCTRITDKAFCNYKALENITLHAGIEYIGDHAFSGTGIENVYVDSLETWFKICDNIYKSNGRATYKANPMYVAQNLYVAGELLVDLVIPETITEIPAYGLYNIKSIKSVTFHSGITTVHNHSFNSCTNIKEVYVPDIGTYARVGAVNQSSTLDTIYVDGEPLVNLVVPEGTERLPAYCFKNYDKLESITIKSGLKYIGAGCFEGCDGLRDVYVDSIKNWLDISFDGSSANPMTVAENLYIAGENVENLVIDESVTAIPEYAFSGYKGLKSVTFPSTLVSIGKKAFMGCSGLESVSFPASLAFIDEDAFMGCSRITEIHSPSLEHWLSIVFLSIESNPITADAKLYIGGEFLEELRVPESIKDINNYAFYGYKHLKAFYVNGNSLSIYSKAFGPHCSDMSIYAETLEDWLKINEDFYTNAAYETLMDCGATLYIAGEKPVEIIIPDTVKKIPWSAFQGCKSLRKITIPATTSVGKYAFKHSGLREIVYGSLIEKTAPVMAVDGDGLEDCILYEKITFGYGVKSVSKDAFKDETNLKEVVFLNGIEEIGEQAFYNTGISTLTIPSSVKKIGKRAFTYSKSLESLTLGDKTGQPAVMNIDNVAFTYCSKLTKVTFNSGIKTMGEKVFYKSYEITDVYVNDLKAYLEMELPLNLGAGSESNPARFADNIYINGKIAKDVVIPEGVTRICAYAFSRCESIETVKFPSTLKYIDDGAFESCWNLKGLTLPDSLETIGESAFWACISITSVNFGYNLKDVGWMAFEYCTSLRIVYMYPEQLEISEAAFIECNNIKLILYTGTKEAWNKLLNENKGSGLEGIAVYYRFRPESMYAPASVTSTQTVDSITVAWSSVTGVTGYRLFMKQDNSWKTMKTVKDTTVKVTGLKSGSKYTFAVKAYISSGAFVLWSPEYITIDTATKAIKPSKVTSTQSSSAIKLSWTSCPGATGYRIYQNSGNGWKVALSTTPATSHTFNGLKAGAKQTYAVRPYIKAGDNVIWSDYTTVEATVRAAKPSKVTAKQTASSITLSWPKVSGATGYRIYFKSGNNWKVAVNTTTATSHTFKNLKAGAKYTFAVRPYIKNGSTVIWSDYTTCIAATTPAAVTAKAASSASGRVALTWNAVSGADGYQVYYKVGNGGYQLYKTYGSVQTLNFSGLKSGTQYTFAVRAGVRTSGGNIFGSYKTATVTVK